MRWHVSWRFDPRALPLANTHYNRQSIGSPQFVAPGSCLVLLTADARALWVSLSQQHVLHAWPDAWNNSLFRNEGAGLSSELIREAVAATRWHFGAVPANGMITFIDVAKIRHKRDPGRCYLKAGFRRVGTTKTHGLHVLQLVESDMPPAEMPFGAQSELLLG